MIIIKDLPSELDILSKIIPSIMSEIKALSLSEEDCFNIKLSLEEALTNAIKHGNKMNPALFVKLKIEYAHDKLTITIEDQGEGFDYQHLSDPSKDGNLHNTSGRGVFLIKNLMDEVNFFSGGRGIKMTKSCKKEAKT